jgi:zinc transporter 1/2/3
MAQSDPGVLILKIFFIIFVFFLAIGSGVMPLKLQAFKNSSTAIGLANAFSGGLFLSIALFHVLPDVSERFVTMQEDPLTAMTAPLPYILMFAGYTIVLTVDRVMFDSHALFDDHGDGGHGHGEKEEHGHGHNDKKGKGHSSHEELDKPHKDHEKEHKHGEKKGHKKHGDENSMAALLG